MKKILILLIVSCACMAGFSQQVIVDANAELREVNGAFHSIIVSDAIDLYLSQSADEAVAVSSSDKKYTDNIKAVVENGTLRIYFDGSWSGKKNGKLKAYVSFRQLQLLEASGATDVRFNDVVASPSLVIKLSGASDLRGNIRADTLQLNLSSASSMRLGGTAAVLIIESSGASDVRAFDLQANTCTAKASGASDINITVKEALTAQANGASNIFYKGDAEAKDVKAKGASTTAKKS